MPELPEVEIIKRELSSQIVGSTINSTFYSGKKFKRPIFGLDSLKGQTIISLKRRNKYIVFETNDYWLVFHLGMTGNLLFGTSLEKGKHSHVMLNIDSGQQLLFQDPRRFGSVDLYSKSNYKNYLMLPIFNKLGIEPLSNSFTFESFIDILHGKQNIKSFLMDSSKVCGIGNIYACEILFRSSLSPFLIVDNIPETSKTILYMNIKNVLSLAISNGGSSISDFVHTNGTSGKMQDFYNVYGKNGEICKICHGLIERIKQNGRSTYYCINCQK